ncbi:MAG: hypothetical protein IKJ17_04185 [Clostridia bacterium]|nr:hypothetical protein [Clostridia bacterium]
MQTFVFEKKNKAVIVMVNSVFSEKKKTKKSANPRQDKIAVFSRRKGAGILCVFQARQQRKTAILLVSGGVDYYYNCLKIQIGESALRKEKTIAVPRLLLN